MLVKLYTQFTKLISAMKAGFKISTPLSEVGAFFLNVKQQQLLQMAHPRLQTSKQQQQYDILEQSVS